MGVYDDLGVRTIINAKGPATRLSGGIPAPEVLAAMTEAAQSCVDMAELQAAASKVIADATGAEAGLVTSGAAAGLLVGTAACMTGLDPGKMARLPDARGIRNEVVMVRSQRNFYDHAVRTAGARIVEVGLPDRYAGAGVRDAEPWEIADAITPDTAAVLWVADAAARPPLKDVVAATRATGVPVLVDAAGELPPAGNLRRFVAEGADLVAFSGGKAIGGPQGSGILCGRRDLIMAAALQTLDLDIFWEQWRPPASLIDKHRLKGLPPHGVGRPCKTGKETIVGLLVALKRFVSEADGRRSERWLEIARRIEAAAGPLRQAHWVMQGAMHDVPVPRLALHLTPEARLDAPGLCFELETGSPAIHADPSRLEEGVVVFNPMCLGDDEALAIGERLRALLG